MKSRLLDYINKQLTQELRDSILKEFDNRNPECTNIRIQLENLEPTNGTEHITIELITDISCTVPVDHAAYKRYWDIYYIYGPLRCKELGLKEPEMITKIIPDQPFLKLFSIQLSPYPACCAMQQANYFYYNFSMPQKIVDQLMELVIQAYRYVILGREMRFIFNFVEKSQRAEDFFRNRGSGNTRLDVMKVKIDGIHEADIQYPYIFNWAKRQFGFQSMGCFNLNSGNIVHTAYVIPSNQLIAEK